LLTRTLAGGSGSTSGLATSICLGIGGRSSETDDAIIDMKPQPESSTQEVLAGLVERVTYHNAENGAIDPGFDSDYPNMFLHDKVTP